MPYIFTQNWFEQNSGYWSHLKKYLHDTFGQNLKCLDVGTFEGRSAIYMLDNLVGDNGELFIVDPMRTKYKQTLLDNLVASGKRESVIICEGDSLTRMPELLNHHDQSFDFIYIDAGKSASDNLLNLLIGERLLKKKGLIVMDDYMWGLNPDNDKRGLPNTGAHFFALCSMLCVEQNTPRTQICFLKQHGNEIYNKVNK